MRQKLTRRITLEAFQAEIEGPGLTGFAAWRRLYQISGPIDRAIIWGEGLLVVVCVAVAIVTKQWWLFIAGAISAWLVVSDLYTFRWTLARLRKDGIATGFSPSDDERLHGESAQ